MPVPPSLPSHLTSLPPPTTYPALSYLIVFNTTLKPPPPPPPQHTDVAESSSSTIDPDDIKEYAQVLCYIRGPASRKGKEKAIELSQRDDLLLRRLGLAKGMLGLTDMVTVKPSQGLVDTPRSEQRDFVIVHTVNKRHITCMVEDDIWLHLVIDLIPADPSPTPTSQTVDSSSTLTLRRTTKSNSIPTNSPSTQHKPSTRNPSNEKGESKVSDEWIKMSVNKAWDEWMLLYGRMNEYLSNKGREALEEALNGYWSIFCLVWSPAMQGKEMSDDGLRDFPPLSESITNSPEWKDILKSLPQDSMALLQSSDGPTLVPFLHRLLLSRTAATAKHPTPNKGNVQPIQAHNDSKRSTSGTWQTLGLGNIMDVDWKPILTLGFAGGRSGDITRSSSPSPSPPVVNATQDGTTTTTTRTRPCEPVRGEPILPIPAIPVRTKTNSIDSSISNSPSNWASGLSSSLRSGLGQVGSGLVAGVSPVTNGVGRVFSGKAGTVGDREGDEAQQPSRN